MNTYLIQQKIKTLSVAVGDFKKRDLAINSAPKMEIDDFLFRQWDFNLRDGWIGDAWIVEREMEAKNFIEALNRFNKGLSLVIPRICFVSQCFMDYLMQSFLVLRLNNNTRRDFLCRYTQEVKQSVLHFDEREIESYKKLKDYQYQSVFRYLQECNNIATYFPKLALIFPALEVMSGKIEKTKDDGTIITTYDKELMIDILGGDLYNRVFGSNGLRHRFYHGEFNFEVDQDYVNKLYEKILEYFNNKFGTGISKDIVSPQRNFSGAYRERKIWLYPKNLSIKINLPSVSSEFNDDIDRNNLDNYELIIPPWTIKEVSEY